tara:strand:- start:616 stop:732 length:117 start_codon:yes stop_codon:yes gene_type:complete
MLKKLINIILDNKESGDLDSQFWIQKILLKQKFYRKKY